MAGGLSCLEANLNVVAGAATLLAWSFLPIMGEKGALNGRGLALASREGLNYALEELLSWEKKACHACMGSY